MPHSVSSPCARAHPLPTGSAVMLRRLLLMLIAAASLLTGPALAEGPSIDAVFGWGGHTPTERWSPLTIYIHSPARSISGTMLIEYTQDPFQQAQIAAPFAAVADQTTPLQSVICLPPGCDSMRITLLDPRGRALARTDFTNAPSMRSGSLGALRAYSQGLLVCIGLPRLPEAMRVLSQAEIDSAVIPERGRPPQGTRSRWADITAVNVRPEDLPLSPMAYDGVMAIVVNGDAAMVISRPALDAIHQWVLAGGRLVVVADAPGEQWRNWLPADASDNIETSRPRPGSLPGAIHDAIANAAAPAGRDTSEVEPAVTISRRVLRITDAGRREGWKADLVAHAGEEPDAEDQAFGAEGPAGFGFVTVLGFDPHRTTRTISSHAAAAVWVRAIETISSEFFAATEIPERHWSARHGSRAQQAINAALEPLAKVPVLGYTTFIVIAASVALLALLVGPVDYVALRRLRALQRSWLTALLWIAVASGLAIAGPRIIRTDPTQVNRLSVIDQFSSGNAPALAYTTGLTGIYAGYAGRAQLTDVDPSSWWRGTSAVRYFQTSTGAAPVPTVQEAVAGDRGSVRGNAMRVLPMAQWTFRTFLDQSTRGLPGADLRIRIDGDAADGMLIISGLPRDAVIRRTALRFGEQIHELAPPGEGEAGDGAWTARYGEATRIDEEAFAHAWVLDVSRHRPGRQQSQSERSAALTIPGPDRRLLAIESRLASGAWAALYIHIENCPPYPKLNWETNASHAAIMRVLVPLGTGAEE